MLKAEWIKSPDTYGEICPVFKKDFSVLSGFSSATLKITARGVYEARINGERVGDFVMAPGWTEYESRLQVQEYDITDMISYKNEITVLVADGWYLGRVSMGRASGKPMDFEGSPTCDIRKNKAIIVQIDITYPDGTVQSVSSDTDWLVAKSNLLFCDIYDGEIYDANVTPKFIDNALLDRYDDKSMLILQEGEKVVENERIAASEIIITPGGEKVIDFGQNLTGYVEVKVTAKKGERIKLSFSEILDHDGNFYNRNYRAAKCLYEYICKDGEQTHKPPLTFYGFRYIRIDEFPSEEISPECFTAIAVHSDIKRTGSIVTSNTKINQLFRNIIWGQKCNFLDIPTDCPQRDERLGWTGDAEVFIKTATYNYDVHNFFIKWINDMIASQFENGAVPYVVPNVFRNNLGAAAWGDAITICPWQIYLTYGDTDILKRTFPAMKRWLDYINSVTEIKGMWSGGWQFGDWLELGAPYGQKKGYTRDTLVATAFYANSVDIVCKTGRILGEDISEYEKLYAEIVKNFKEHFFLPLRTQTEHILVIRFGLSDDLQAVADNLAQRIKDDGVKIQTGFVGTPYILHALSRYGYSELAYDLLLREEFPSWLYTVNMGATTMWEHWDGLTPQGDIWPDSMNSYNHYAYGSVADWMYEVCAGICTVEENPGFKEIIFKPVPTDKIDSISAQIETKYGTVKSMWYHCDGKIRYEITTPTDAKAYINGKCYYLKAGNYVF